MTLSGSLVLFHSDPELYEVAIRAYLNGCNGLLYVVDNSLTPLESELFHHSRVVYIHSGRNLGFGAGHNLALSILDNKSEFHLILNPDVCFGVDVIPYLQDLLKSNHEIAVAMPRINYPDGSLQHLCKLLPNPIDLIFRRFIPLKMFQDSINRRYELHGLPQDRLVEVPMISGCFFISRTSILKKMGGFDEQFFMYFEDVDLVRRISGEGSVIYAPQVIVTHAYAKGSYRNWRLLRYHLQSAIKYFNKWGWFYDPLRRKKNLKMAYLDSSLGHS